MLLLQNRDFDRKTFRLRGIILSSEEAFSPSGVASPRRAGVSRIAEVPFPSTKDYRQSGWSHGSVRDRPYSTTPRPACCPPTPPIPNLLSPESRQRSVPTLSGCHCPSPAIASVLRESGSGGTAAGRAEGGATGIRQGPRVGTQDPCGVWLGVRVYGCVWVYGCMGVWLYGCMGVWVSDQI